MRLFRNWIPVVGLLSSFVGTVASAQLPSLRANFDRIDTTVGEIDGPELEAYFFSLGIGTGALGGIELALARNEFLQSFDLDANNTISFREFVEGSGDILPVRLRDPSGAPDEARIPDLMPSIVSADGVTVTRASLAPYLETEIRATRTGLAVVFANRMSKAAAKVMVDFLDGDADLDFTADDMEIYIEDIKTELARP